MGPHSKNVSADEIRKVFSTGDYFQRLQDGEFDFEVRDLGPPLTRAGENLPTGMREQIVRYRDRITRRTVAVVHQRAGDAYGNPPDHVWADPKYVLHNGVRYHHDRRLDLP